MAAADVATNVPCMFICGDPATVMRCKWPEYIATNDAAYLVGALMTTNAQIELREDVTIFTGDYQLITAPGINLWSTNHPMPTLTYVGAITFGELSFCSHIGLDVDSFVGADGFCSDALTIMNAYDVWLDGTKRPALQRNLWVHSLRQWADGLNTVGNVIVETGTITTWGSPVRSVIGTLDIKDALLVPSGQVTFATITLESGGSVHMNRCVVKPRPNPGFTIGTSWNLDLTATNGNPNLCGVAIFNSAVSGPADIFNVKVLK